MQLVIRKDFFVNKSTDLVLTNCLSSVNLQSNYSCRRSVLVYIQGINIDANVQKHSEHRSDPDLGHGGTHSLPS